MLYTIDLSDSPWSYLLKVLDDPDIKLGKFRLWVSFRVLLADIRFSFSEIRYIRIPTRKYLEFACYFAGLLAVNSEYHSATPAILIADESGMTFANTCLKELELGRRQMKWGNKSIDAMLSSLRH